MTHFLFKPHVQGPEDRITTPDILIDRIALTTNADLRAVPVHRVSSSVGLQVTETALEATPAYALIAAGGGTLLGVSVLVGECGASIEKSDVLLARSAWRLRNLLPHFASLRLLVAARARESATVLAELTHPADTGVCLDSHFSLPRGVLVIVPAISHLIELAAPDELRVCLTDQVLNRELSHSTTLVSVQDNAWENRPAPRYSVGPVGDVDDYI